MFLESLSWLLQLIPMCCAICGHDVRAPAIRAPLTIILEMFGAEVHGFEHVQTCPHRPQYQLTLTGSSPFRVAMK